MTTTFTDEQSAKLLELLGLPADTDTADVDAILAVVEDLAKQANEAAAAKPSDVAAAAKRIGLEAIDADSIAALRADAAEGRQLKVAAAKEKIETTVAAAISKGKITPARRTHWVNLITADPGMADVLASVPDETAAPMTEIGHGQTGDDNYTTEAATWFR